jgi:MerR family transcriptional regulator, light-induced transcriptional regulator
MTIGEVFKQYMEHLFHGKRCESRELIVAAADRGIAACKLLQCVIWPAMEQVEKLYRQNLISRITEHIAMRINRMIANLLLGSLAREPKTGKRMVVICGNGDVEELGAQIVSDIFEARGWSVWLLGSGVPNDEVLQFLGKTRPEILCVYGMHPSGVPNVRGLIAMIREIGILQEMQVMVAGGIFNRAEGLADEIKADLHAANAAEALKTVEEHPVRVPKPDVPEPGRRRKRKRLVQSHLHALRKMKLVGAGA